MSAALREGPDRDALAAEREMIRFAALQRQLADRKVDLWPVWVEAVEQVAELTHVDTAAILDCKASTAIRTTPINAPALTARNLAVYISSRAGLRNSDIAIVSGVGQVSVSRIIERVSRASQSNAQCRALINASIACVSSVIAERGIV